MVEVDRLVEQPREMSQLIIRTPLDRSIQLAGRNAQGRCRLPTVVRRLLLDPRIVAEHAFRARGDAINFGAAAAGRIVVRDLQGLRETLRRRERGVGFIIIPNIAIRPPCSLLAVEHLGFEACTLDRHGARQHGAVGQVPDAIGDRVDLQRTRHRQPALGRRAVGP